MRRNDRFHLEPAQDLETVPLVSADFDVPTGRLLLTDTLRVSGFSNGIEFDADRAYGALSLNHEAGCVARTKAHASEHGLGFAQTTNTYVVAHLHPTSGRIIVSECWTSDGKEDADGDAAALGWKKIGTFSCDVWRVTAVDQATACALMTAGGNASARATLDAYLASDDTYAQNVLRLDVPAGPWRIHSGPDFAERVDRAAFDIPDHIMPWLVLEPVTA
ncbi:hypothetical protein [Sphingosinicella sp. BN140058]|uniref:hypothetical protein n=1 Tax=Sphingosinicella sp. BN140058 TaxID=1892855 RepID=UPI001012B111|nr:hypothetical protein [Sphingosinicella sp. BN140058]QAY80271.1 hypothetical protein ETR14_26875 [Sphingosinicella sp. BN140058]